MSDSTYDPRARREKELVWLGRGVNTPPFSVSARVEAGYRLRLLQRGFRMGMPHSRPMPTIGARCHELRVRDADHQWRLIYRIDRDVILVVEVFDKDSRRTSGEVIELCRERLRAYDRTKAGGSDG